MCAGAAVIALSMLLISNFYRDSAIISPPVHAPVTTAYAQLPGASSRSAPFSDVPGFPQLRSGLRIVVFAHGLSCNESSWEASNLLPLESATAAQFTHISILDNATGAVSQIFDCPSCALLPVSFIDVRLDVACQALMIAVWAVGADGIVQAGSYTASTAPATALAVSIVTTLQVGVVGFIVNSASIAVENVACFVLQILTTRNQQDSTTVRGFQVLPSCENTYSRSAFHSHNPRCTGLPNNRDRTLQR